MASHTYTNGEHIMVRYEDGTIMSDREVDAMVILIKRGFPITKQNILEVASGCIECVRALNECVCE